MEEDLDADQQALTELAEWSQRFSPIVGLEDAIAPTCLLIDMTGGAACFGGEEALVYRALEEFKQTGWSVAIALADTIAVAWAMAHYGLAPNALSVVCESGWFPQDLPIAALRLSTFTALLLAQLGIGHVGQLMQLPRDEIAERFGPEVGLRLDQATGQVAEVIAPFHAQPDARACWRFDDPVDRHEIVVKILDLLMERLQAILEKRHVGTRLLECVLELDGADAKRFECSLSQPAQTARYLSGLLRTRLEQVRVEAPVRAMCVRAVVLERMPDQQPNLFDTGSDAALAQLLDSLASRLGRDVITTPHFVADPQPELACRFESALDPSLKESDVDERVFVHRPLRLFSRPIAIQVVAIVPDGTPQRFRHAGIDHTVLRCHGPERIETGWWRAADISRDYFMAETTDGTRWWLFHRLNDGRWFLHGCFD